MYCPRCSGSPLTERDRDGVTIDVCTACRGIWLDRGELEKLIARAARESEPPAFAGDHDMFDDDRDDRHRRPPREYREADRDPRRGPERKRRWYESFGDIFD